MSDRKWYSHGMAQRDVSKFTKHYARIDTASVGLDDRDRLALDLTLTFEDGVGASPKLENHDIAELLKETGQRNVSRLKGKVIEVYLEDAVVRCIGVNKNLIVGAGE